MRRHFHLPRQQHMLVRLRHRPVRRRHHQDRPVHLRRTRDHVLDVVPVPGHVHVRIVPLVRLVFHVRNVDRDAARLLFRRVVDLVVGLELRLPQHLADLRDRRRQRRLPVVDVPHRPHVHMRLVPLKFLLRHFLFLLFLLHLARHRARLVLSHLRSGSKLAATSSNRAHGGNWTHDPTLTKGVAANAFFVAAEFSLVSIRDTRIEQLIEAKRAGARTIQKLHRKLDEVLNGVQLGVTMASLALGWLGENALARVLEHPLGQLPHAAVYAHAISIALAFGLITYFHVILGEVVPKSVSLQQAERVALAVASRWTYS